MKTRSIKMIINRLITTSNLAVLVFFLSLITLKAQNNDLIKKNYSKTECYVPMRDSIRLFTSIYSPRDKSGKYPILIMRTPYGIKPYGPDTFPPMLGPSKYFANDKYIFVYQDVRGKFMSEGIFENMTAAKPHKSSGQMADNSTDTYDLVEWLLKNVQNNNGKVGLWGISYPGFYAVAGILNTHPAIKCASPQAPIADWFIDDDIHHNGAFALIMAYNFFEIFGINTDKPYQQRSSKKIYPTKDAYNFFLGINPLRNVNEKYFENKVPFWDSIALHDTYDYFWKQKSTSSLLNNIKPAVMTVGGWFDGEDLYGTLETYKSIENQNPNVFNILVMGPWIHGGWAGTKGDSLGLIAFDSETSDFYQKEIEKKFFDHFLKDTTIPDLPEILAFETGTNVWKTYNKWPPEKSHFESLYFCEKNGLTFEKPGNPGFIYDEYISNPYKPVPYTQSFHASGLFYNKEYPTEDQRFASARPDVLYYQTDFLENDLTVTGPVQADLYVSTSGTDADWVVKLIDVFPDTILTERPAKASVEMAGYQMLVRGEILRGKFRNSIEKPQPFMAGKIEHISFKLQGINHTFKQGHRIMVQVQSSWFPLFDRNPQQFMNIFEATDKDFVISTNRIYRSSNHPSSIIFRVTK